MEKIARWFTVQAKEANLKRWELWFLGGIFLVSLVLRLAYLSETKDNLLFNHPRLDEQFHDKWALSIAGGNIIGDKVFFRAPVYPYLLGLS